MWFIGVEVEQETSAPPPKKILDPPLMLCKWHNTDLQAACTCTHLLKTEGVMTRVSTDHDMIRKTFKLQFLSFELRFQIVDEKLHSLQIDAD